MNQIASHTSDVAASQQASLISVIARAASDPACDIDKMERLLQMQERVQATQAEASFNAALSACQGEIGRVAADKLNSQTGSMYATYAAIDRMVRPTYTKHGLSLSFSTEPAEPGMVGIICYVSHEAGHTRTYHAAVPSDGKGIKGTQMMTSTHAFGSGSSYGMRYLVKMIFNIAIGEDDDDGQSAGRSQSGGKVTSEQAAELQALSDQVVTNPDAFLSWLQKGCKDQSIQTLADVPAKNYPSVRARLNEMLKEKTA